MFRPLVSIAILALLATLLVWQYRAEQKTPALANETAAATAAGQAQDTSPAASQALSAVPSPIPAQSATQIPAQDPASAPSPNQAGKPISNTQADKPQRRQPLSDRELAALLERRLTPAMRRAINEQLQPGGSPPREKQGRYGSYLDFSDRAASVMIAVIDDDGNTVITDVMQALPVEGH
ncbi:MAG: hypothetical protein WBN40_08885 [Pseudomonadales bacterium]